MEIVAFKGIILIFGAIQTRQKINLKDFFKTVVIIISSNIGFVYILYITPSKGPGPWRKINDIDLLF
jgi:hypothetical protein